MSIIDNFIGRVRSPHYAQLTLDARSGKLIMSFVAQDAKGGKTTFEREYATQLITGEVVQDLLGWLKQTARACWGSESGGL
jgi:hypothetical protein